MMSIDFVIPTSKNIETSHSSIYYTIRSILAQNLQPQNIFIVENCFNTGVCDFLQYHFGTLVKVIPNDGQENNISYARNKGASLSDSEILLFMDDDVVIGNNDFLRQIQVKMYYEDFYCGAYRYWSETNWHKYINKEYSLNHIHRILKARSFKPISIERNSGSRNFHDFSFIGNFGAIKRSIFQEIGGFDEEYKGWTYQDTDLMMRLCEKEYSYQLMMYDDIYVYHLSHPADKSQFMGKNRELYCEKQKQMKVKFNLSHFFGIFNSDQDLSIIQRL
jgi:GT2 family glycosyltransferase